MFESLKRGITKVLVFALLSILVLSFAVWGIGDTIRSGGGQAIATVGDTEIAAEEFTRALQIRRQALTRQLGQSLTPEQSRAFGIDAGVLGELVNGAAVANHARDMGLRLSDQSVAELIRSDPSFHGADKAFSRPIFDERMRQAGFTEQRYFEQRRRDEIQGQLTGALVDGVVVSDTMLNLAHRFREETRTLAYVTLDPASVAKSPAPDDAALQKIYDENKRRFAIPEKRRIAVLMLTADELKTRAKVSDDEVKKSWEQSRIAWDLPERRRIQQIYFDTVGEAKGEAEAIEGGKSFLLAALEANGAQGRLDQGLVARREISDSNYGKIAFELPLNKLSPPIAVRNGYVLIRISEIQPGRERPFTEVAEEVRSNLEETRRREIVAKLHDDIEDKRGASEAKEKLKPIANELKLKLIEVASVDAKGIGDDGKPAIAHPDQAQIVASAFEGDRFTPREVLTLSDGTEAWVEVIAVTPEVTKPLADVKDEVLKLWQEQEVGTALTKQSRTLADRIKAGESLVTIAKGLGPKGADAKIETTEPFKRSAPAKGLSPAAARLAFTLAKGGAGSAASADGKSRVVFVVKDVKLPEAPSADAAKTLREELASELRGDALQIYVGALRTRQNAKINDGVYRRAVGLEQP